MWSDWSDQKLPLALGGLGGQKLPRTLGDLGDQKLPQVLGDHDLPAVLDLAVSDFEDLELGIGEDEDVIYEDMSKSSTEDVGAQYATTTSMTMMLLWSVEQVVTAVVCTKAVNTNKVWHSMPILFGWTI